MPANIKKSDLSSRRKRFFLVAFIFALILGDVFFFPKNSDLRTFPILFIYVFFINRFKIPAKTTFIMCLIFFVLIYAQYVFSAPTVFDSQYPLVPAGEKFAVWLYLFLLIGVIQKWRE